VPVLFPTDTADPAREAEPAVAFEGSGALGLRVEEAFSLDFGGPAAASGRTVISGGGRAT